MVLLVFSDVSVFCDQICIVFYRLYAFLQGFSSLASHRYACFFPRLSCYSVVHVTMCRVSQSRGKGTCFACNLQCSSQVALPRCLAGSVFFDCDSQAIL